MTLLFLYTCLLPSLFPYTLQVRNRPREVVNLVSLIKKHLMSICYILIIIAIAITY